MACRKGRYLGLPHIQTHGTSSGSPTHGTCLASVRKWMCHKSLKLNAKKTEMLLISTKQLATKLDSHTLLIGEQQVTPATVVRNIGVIMDTHASMEAHVNNVPRAAYYHLYNIGRFRCHLSQYAAEQLVHDFITSKLDYCNALLCGLLSLLTQKLQPIQNAAASIVTRQQIGPHNASPVRATLAAGMPST